MEKTESITLAGGCFWCTEAIFKRLKGVRSVVSGYSGGEKQNPTYEEVCSGRTGHAETIQIEFDPKILSLEKLLEIFFHLHNPTTLNRQGADIGEQYRSEIFFRDKNQEKIALEVKEKIKSEKTYNDPIVTKITPFKSFFKAEENHQNYYEKNKKYPYCQIIIEPKIQKLLKEFSDQVA